MSLVSGTTPDLAAIKQRQQAIWASGDYHRIGTQILIVSELLIETLDLRSTERVLDVATGSGMPRLRPPGAAAPSSASTNANNVPPPVGLRSPVWWGTGERLRELFGDAIAEISSSSG
jgi:hypothetical protein